jgi:hypothetical protein
VPELLPDVPAAARLAPDAPAVLPAGLATLGRRESPPLSAEQLAIANSPQSASPTAARSAIQSLFVRAGC